MYTTEHELILNLNLSPYRLQVKLTLKITTLLEKLCLSALIGYIYTVLYNSYQLVYYSGQASAK